MMRENIFPVWEDKHNGGSSLVRIQVGDNKLLEIWEDICTYTLNEQIVGIDNDVTGLSFNTKDDFVSIKIWSQQCDTSSIIHPSISKKHKIRFDYMKFGGRIESNASRNKKYAH